MHGWGWMSDRTSQARIIGGTRGCAEPLYNAIPYPQLMRGAEFSQPRSRSTSSNSASGSSASHSRDSAVCAHEASASTAVVPGLVRSSEPGGEGQSRQTPCGDKQGWSRGRPKLASDRCRPTTTEPMECGEPPGDEASSISPPPSERQPAHLNMSRIAELKPLVFPKAATMTPTIFSLSDGRKQVQWSTSKASNERLVSRKSPCSTSARKTGSNWTSHTLPPMCTKVNNSTTHQRRLRYVGPAKTTRRLQPLRKTGRQRRSVSMLHWSMQHLSIQITGSLPNSATKSARQR
mmetsp:Transcript_43229/g.124990  ORF Transcript_43229/g.124990 Transcript_43229/m.124990 type:complete len:291 (+) Transcript_43229:138-1010(+)